MAPRRPRGLRSVGLGLGVALAPRSYDRVPCAIAFTDNEESAYMAPKSKRTTHRSSKGTKLYAVRTAAGEFADIQTYERAHGSDVKKSSKAEVAAKAKAKGKTKKKK
jgi:hypothetical protein